MASSSKTHRTVERWIEYYARFGYGAKGVIYGSTGLLALLEALDISEGETVGSEGALKTIGAQPFGRAMLVVLGISLMGYVGWRFIQAVLDPEHSGTDASDILRRFSYACSGLAYVGVAFTAVKILTAGSSEGGTTTQERVVKLIRMPYGQWLVGAGGLIVFGIGCYYFYRAIKAEFRKQFKHHQMSDAAKTWANIVGRVGIAARGFVYVVIGFFGMRAAWSFDPSLIKTTEEAMAVFDNDSTDEWILATLGVGFIAYGVHMGFQAVYRSIDPL
ncbi:MAG: hypothetical protein DCF25_21610 [Leptolyngbya foveolarum]|uniref:DUF1206 domain-containing protein n=1 Tax=Leptolyngbya foveolarum TaxID=47253 RepID=A0A2W4VBM5_9CYAN|nr:MAG: hypothetical protein DCF25_21610 [Leptolyngbya foveolarum]